MGDRDDEEAGKRVVSLACSEICVRSAKKGPISPIRVIRNTSQSIIPCREGSEQSKDTTSLDDCRVWLTGGDGLQVSDAEE